MAHNAPRADSESETPTRNQPETPTPDTSTSRTSQDEDTPTPTPAPSPSATTVVPPDVTTVITSVVTEPSTPQPDDTVVVTLTRSKTSTGPPETTQSNSAPPSATTTTPLISPTSDPSQSNSDGSLSDGAKTAIAVVVPIVAVALLVILGIILWRRHTNKKRQEQDRLKEVQEYGGFGPVGGAAQSPKLPVVDSGAVGDGYRNWGGAATTGAATGAAVGTGAALATANQPGYYGDKYVEQANNGYAPYAAAGGAATGLAADEEKYPTEHGYPMEQNYGGPEPTYPVEHGYGGEPQYGPEPTYGDQNYNPAAGAAGAGAGEHGKPVVDTEQRPLSMFLPPGTVLTSPTGGSGPGGAFPGKDAAYYDHVQQQHDHDVPSSLQSGGGRGPTIASNF